MSVRILAAVLLTGWCCCQVAPAAVTFEFNYDYDLAGFFDDPATREILELAADSVVRSIDVLEPIVPDLSAGNSWTGVVPLPDLTTGIFQNLVVPEDTIIVYVGGLDFAVNTLALTQKTSAVNIVGSPAWESTVTTRGQAGAAQGPLVEDTDYGPWGASITFYTQHDWHIGKTTDGLAGKFDFLSVAMHELGHVLGVGPADSWKDRIVDGKFTGPEAVAVSSPSNPDLDLHSDGGHYLEDTDSFVSGVLQTAAMDPFFDPGERKLFTDLDFATLQDVGWQPAAYGDTDRDGDVDTDDISLILGSLSFSTGPYTSLPGGGFAASSSPTAFLTSTLSIIVPEPSSLMILLTGLAGLALTGLGGRARARRRR